MIRRVSVEVELFSALEIASVSASTSVSEISLMSGEVGRFKMMRSSDCFGSNNINGFRYR